MQVCSQLLVVDELHSLLSTKHHPMKEPGNSHSELTVTRAIVVVESVSGVAAASDATILVVAVLITHIA